MLSDRVRKLRGRLRAIDPRLDVSRLRCLKEASEVAEGVPTIIKRAGLFEKYLAGKEIYIDDSLLVGTMTKYELGLQPMVEVSCRWMRREVEHSCLIGSLEVTEEDRKELMEAVDYWQDKCSFSRAQQLYSELYPGEDYRTIAKSGVFLDGSSQGSGTISADYDKILNKGYNGIIEEIEAELAKVTTGDQEAIRRRDQYKAMLISLRAAINYARRYASLAREMAGKETDPVRKEELTRIAKTCEWVPANPARDFYEALQCWWMTTVCCWIEDSPLGFVMGRFSQFMYPFYKKDKDEGRITEEEAIELLEMLFIHINEGGLFNSGVSRKANSGQTSSNCTLGGVTADNEDATNEIDWLLLETQNRVMCIQPTLSLLYHDKMSEEFMVKACEVVRDTGLGQPAFFNNDIAVQRTLHHYPGIPFDEARNIGHQGCVQTAPAYSTGNTWEGAFNMVKMLELALNNGKDPVSGIQVGPQTGKAEDFQSYEELNEAVKKQLLYLEPRGINFETLSYSMQGEIKPTPFQSCFVNDCIKLGKDIMQGGSRYASQGTVPVAGVDLGNSLATIKKLVFEDKRTTIKEIKEALAADFEGYEEMQKMCLDAPKFGNDIDWVDRIVREYTDLFYDIQHEIPDYTGRPHVPQAFSVSNHFNFGSVTGALPTGRKAGIALTDGVCSPMPGTDKGGPTVVIKSAAKAFDNSKYGSSHFNMRFHPSALEGWAGLRKLVVLIKTYMDIGGYHIQFNCVSGDTLMDAQVHPENYRDLIVRVAGFSAFYVILDKGIQDEIIKRSELEF